MSMETDDDITVLPPETEDKTGIINNYSDRYIISSSFRPFDSSGGSLHALHTAYKDLKIRYNDQLMKCTAMNHYIRDLETQKNMAKEGSGAAGNTSETFGPQEVVSDKKLQQMKDSFEVQTQALETKITKLEQEYNTAVQEISAWKRKHDRVQEKFSIVASENEELKNSLSSIQQQQPQRQGILGMSLSLGRSGVGGQSMEKQLLNLLEEQKRSMNELLKKVQYQSHIISEQTAMLKKLQALKTAKAKTSSMVRQIDGESMHHVYNENSGKKQMTLQTPRSDREAPLIDLNGEVSNGVIPNDLGRLNTASLQQDIPRIPVRTFNQRENLAMRNSYLQEEESLFTSSSVPMDPYLRTANAQNAMFPDSVKNCGRDQLVPEGLSRAPLSPDKTTCNISPRTSPSRNRMGSVRMVDQPTEDVEARDRLSRLQIQAPMQISSEQNPVDIGSFQAEYLDSKYRLPAQGREDRQEISSPVVTSGSRRRTSAREEQDICQPVVDLHGPSFSRQYLPLQQPQQLYQPQQPHHPQQPQQFRQPRELHQPQQHNQPQQAQMSSIGVVQASNGDYENIELLNVAPTVNRIQYPEEAYHWPPEEEPAVIGTERQKQQSGANTCQICPVCKKNFADISMADFQMHAFDCVDSASSCGDGDEMLTLQDERSEVDGRVCPMCDALFPMELPQEQFTRHVQDHFGEENEFEILE